MLVRIGVGIAVAPALGSILREKVRTAYMMEAKIDNNKKTATKNTNVIFIFSV